MVEIFYQYIYIGEYNMKQKKRNSSIELLRIIAMLMIIVLHFVGPYTNLDKSIKNYYLIQFVESISIIGVNIFVIISAYFLMETKKVKLRKIINLISCIVFYGLLFFILAVILKIKPFDKLELLYAVIPFLAGRRWFVLSYITLYLISPYLSFILNKISKKSYRNLILISLIFCSIWSTFLPGGLRLDNGYGIISFIQLFIITGYIKRFHNQTNDKKMNYLIVCIASQLIIFLLSIIRVTDTYWNYNNLFNIISSIALFQFFNKIEIDNKIINKLSSYSFSVYLIHTDFMLSVYVYENIMNRATVITSNYLIIYILVYALLTYAICSLIDIIRKLIFKHTLDKIFDKIKLFNKELECK